jgi:hypothetical protein
VRVKLLKMLRVVLVPRLNPMTSMQYLADITGCIIRGCKHAAPPVQKEAAGVCIALATVLWHEQYKASILKPYTERLCLGLMFALYAKSAKVRAEATVALKCTILCGETKLVQDMVAWNPPNMCDLSRFFASLLCTFAWVLFSLAALLLQAGPDSVLPPACASQHPRAFS